MPAIEVIYLRCTPALKARIVEEAKRRNTQTWRKPDVNATAVALLTQALDGSDVLRETRVVKGAQLVLPKRAPAKRAAKKGGRK